MADNIRPRTMYGMFGGTAMGVDPGLAHLGLAIVSETPEGHLRIVHTDCISTEKDSKTAGLRVSDDDTRRLVTLHKGVLEALFNYKPTLVGLETYVPLAGKGGNGAFKVATVYGLVHGLATSANRPVYAATPQDIRLAFLGKRTGTKTEVEAALHKHCAGIDKALAAYPKSLREHVVDAIAHAILALDRTRVARRMAQKRGKRITVAHEADLEQRA